jgi:hypothetical protein
MLCALRRTCFAPWLVAATLVCVAWLVASPLYHDEGDDRDCAAAYLPHDHSAHRFGTDASDRPSDSPHCFICHWHSLRSVLAVVHIAAPRFASQLVAPDSADGAASPTLLPRSARAPPFA